jgi:hypothetical protein
MKQRKAKQSKAKQRDESYQVLVFDFGVGVEGILL